ncbi:MAG TPA: pyridoxamine 5'-phosphate oxidase family protein [Hanamia sp.]
MFGKMDNTQIEKVISDNFIGRLGCNADGKTYIVPISYAYNGEYIYFHTYEGMKVDIMRKNPNVCFQVDKMDNMAGWESVIAWGTSEELTDPIERKVGLQNLIDRVLPKISSKTVQLTTQWPFPPDDISMINGIIFRIILHEKSGRFEKMDPQVF